MFPGHNLEHYEHRSRLCEHRELALAAYAPDTSMKALAAQLSRTEGSLYQLLARIRQELLRCVERTLAREAHLP